MKTKRPAHRMEVDARALANLLWPGDSRTVYHIREALWMQTWCWSREWIAAALRHNTMRAVIVRGVAMVIGQGVLLGMSAFYGFWLALWMMGVGPWA